MRVCDSDDLLLVESRHFPFESWSIPLLHGAMEMDLSQPVPNMIWKKLYWDDTMIPHLGVAPKPKTHNGIALFINNIMVEY